MLRQTQLWNIDQQNAAGTHAAFRNKNEEDSTATFAVVLVKATEVW